MPDGETSSANPAALRRYSDAGLRMDAQMEASASRLAAVLAEFEATCTEYRTGVGPALAAELRDHTQRTSRDDLWVARVAAAFEQADRVRAAMAQKELDDAAAERGQPLVKPDFLLSRATDAATEWFKAHVQPQVEQRLVARLVSVGEEKVLALKGGEQTVVWFTRTAVQFGVREEVTNAGMLAVKSFVTSPLKGVPLLNGAMQGLTDWVGEPELSTGQRIGRIAVAGVLATGTVVAVAAVAPEGAVAVAIGLAGAAFVDIAVKPLVFDRLGLNAPQPERGGQEQS